MTFDNFITKYNGKYLDWDGNWGAQCMDLLRAYLKEVLNLPPYILPPVDYAKNVFKNFTTSNEFLKVYNGATNMPSKGDIVFWGYYPMVTGWADVGISYASTTMNLITFGQTIRLIHLVI